MDDHNRSKSKRAPLSAPTHFEAKIVEILDHRAVGNSKKNEKTQFLAQ